MNAITTTEGAVLASITEKELIEVLQSSLYPGAALPSIKMVLGYCKAAGLDPMRKPVHIVPMWDSKAKQMRDVTMPGIGLYRTDAARTGEHVGTDEPVFGPMVEYDLNGAKVTVPEWCKVTVYRLKQGMKCAYTATEYWIENYATAGKDTSAPNAMWKKRYRGQLSKCAEAQALRKGFPEVGNQPTADEMEGKFIDMGMGDVVGSPPPAPTPVPEKPAMTAEGLQQRAAKIAEYYKAGKSADDIIDFYSGKASLNDAIKKAIRDIAPKAEATDVTPKGEGRVVTYAQLAERMHKCSEADIGVLILDEARSLPADQQHDLSKIYAEKFGAKE